MNQNTSILHFHKNYGRVTHACYNFQVVVNMANPTCLLGTLSFLQITSSACEEVKGTEKISSHF